MYKVLEDYILIYEKQAMGKVQRKQQYKNSIEWLKKEYNNLPELDVSIEFIIQNENVKFTIQFYNKLIFPQIRIEEDLFNVDGLLFLFETDMIQHYEEYLSFKKTILDLENIVLSKYPNNTIILEYRYKREKWWLEFSIHEVPSGVLCGMNGASYKQIKEMKNNLEDFKELCLLLNKNEQKNISYLETIYNSWESYLIHVDKYNSFQNYLDDNNIEY